MALLIAAAALPSAVAQDAAVCGGQIIDGGSINYPALSNSRSCGQYGSGTCYFDNQACTWDLSCSNNMMPQVVFTAFNTERGWDFVRALDVGEFELWSHSGDLSAALETVVYTQTCAISTATTEFLAHLQLLRDAPLAAAWHS